MSNFNLSGTFEQLWLDFQVLTFKDQLGLIEKLSDKDMVSFIEKLLLRDPVLTNRLFVSFSYQTKEKVLQQIPELKIRDQLCEKLPYSVKAKLLKDNIFITLSDNQLLVFVRSFLKIIPQRSYAKIKLVQQKAKGYGAIKEGWRAQDLVKKTQAQCESWIIGFFAHKLTPQQKFYLSSNLSLLEYKKLILSFYLEIADVFDPIASSINGQNLPFCFSGYFVKNDQHHQKNLEVDNDKIVSWYVDWLSNPEKEELLVGIIRISSQLGDSFWQTIVKEVVDKMDDSKVKKLLRSCKAIRFLIGEQRFFYVNNVNLNNNFHLLEEKVFSGKFVNFNILEPINKLRLLAIA